MSGMETSQYYFPAVETTVTMQHPESHIIECYGYLSEERLLFIKIIDNELYSYENVSSHIFQQMQLSASKGKFFMREIRDYYQYDRIPASMYKVLEEINGVIAPDRIAMPAIHEFNIKRPDCWL